MCWGGRGGEGGHIHQGLDQLFPTISLLNSSVLFVRGPKYPWLPQKFVSAIPPPSPPPCSHTGHGPPSRHTSPVTPGVEGRARPPAPQPITPSATPTDARSSAWRPANQRYRRVRFSPPRARPPALLSRCPPRHLLSYSDRLAPEILSEGSAAGELLAAIRG